MPKPLTNYSLAPVLFITKDKFTFSTTLSKLTAMARLDRNEARTAYLVLPFPLLVGPSHYKLKLKSKIVRLVLPFWSHVWIMLAFARPRILILLC